MICVVFVILRSVIFYFFCRVFVFVPARTCFVSAKSCSDCFVLFYFFFVCFAVLLVDCFSSDELLLFQFRVLRWIWYSLWWCSFFSSTVSVQVCVFCDGGGCSFFLVSSVFVASRWWWAAAGVSDGGVVDVVWDGLSTVQVSLTAFKSAEIC
ncbi:hypothetical protein QL285_088555 [Trifolium repens]|nr:hypothetical protein QL285_088555 [Trifolium repens]